MILWSITSYLMCNDAHSRVALLRNMEVCVGKFALI